MKVILSCLVVAVCFTLAPCLAMAETDGNTKPPEALPGPKNRDEALLEAAALERKQAGLERYLEREGAFEEAFDKAFPINTKQMNAVRDATNSLQEAVRMPPPEQGKIRSKTVSLNPGSPIQEVNLYPHYVTSIRVLDATGSPWPIAAYMVGNETYFSVQRPDMEPHNVIMVAPTVIAGNANLTIVLAAPAGQDQVAPLSLQLQVSPSNRANLDSVVDVRLDRRGPMAPAPSIIGGPVFHTNALMLAILDGVPPRDALPVKTSDPEVMAWRIGDSYYIRTPEQIMWPAWTQTVSSGEQRNSGMHAYELPPVSEVLFAGNKSVTLAPYSDSVNRAIVAKGE